MQNEADKKHTPFPALAQNGVCACKWRLRSWCPDLVCARHWTSSTHLNRPVRPWATGKQILRAEIRWRRYILTSKKNPGNNGNIAQKIVSGKTLLQKNWSLPAKNPWWHEIRECNENGEPGECPRKIGKVCQKLSKFVQVTTGRDF